MRRILLAIALTAAASQVSLAAETERNPFLPPSEAETNRAVEEQRIKGIVRQMFPEIQTLIGDAVSKRDGEIEKKVLEKVQDGQKSAAQPGKGGKPGEVAEDPMVGAKFVACVNGKALYRGKDNENFFSDALPTSGISPCAN